MNFKYRARTSDGEIIEDYIEASEHKRALEQLKNRGMLVISLNAQNTSSQKTFWEALTQMDIGTLLSGGKVPLKKLMVFFRQLSAMENAGVSLATSIDIIAEGEKNSVFRSALEDIHTRIDRGSSLSDAMSQQKIFDAMLVSMIKAGEESQLSSALEQSAILIEKQNDLRSKIRRAMLYPSFIVIFAVAILIFFFVFLVPKFQETFSALNIELPMITTEIFALGNWFSGNWKFLALIFAVIYFAIKILSSNARTKKIMDKIKMKIPVIKDIVLKTAMARSSRTLSALTASGVPLIRGLEMTEGITGNAIVQEGFSELRNNVMRGVSLGDAARQAEIFPVLVSQMMRIGEETSRLDTMLERVANWYDHELDEQINSSVSVLEPAMIIFVGIIIAVIALSVFTPITSAIVQLS